MNCCQSTATCAPTLTFTPRHTATMLRPEESEAKSPLRFSPVTLADVDAINRLLQSASSRSCDYTLGGIYMWINYFRYEYCIYDDTLFIKGVSESDDVTPAFSLPIGQMPMVKAVDLLREYCLERGLTLRFSAIPNDRLADIYATGAWQVTELTNWADYIYDIESLATFAGKKLSKKRNHVNRFIADNLGYSLTTFTAADVDDIIEAWQSWPAYRQVDNEGEPLALEERARTTDILRSISSFPFECAMLRDGEGRIVAFTVAEVIGDTLHEHIEKMNHNVPGAGETICHLFAKAMHEKYPQLRYVNRQDDSGDEGLRQAKQSLHPAYLLAKYELTPQ